MSDFLESYELYHYGVKGQKWGERRYQYQDGSLTPEGKRHYGIGDRIHKRWAHYKEQADINKEYRKVYAEEYSKGPKAKTLS